MEENCKVAGRKSLKEGDVLFREGDTGAEIFIIESGKIRITKQADGKRVVLAELGPGESVGEMAILLSKPRTATAEAITDSELISVNKDNLYEVYFKHTSLCLCYAQKAC